jgi:hypothetical protein
MGGLKMQKWTGDETEKAENMINKGKTYAEIADVLGRSERSVKSKILRIIAKNNSGDSRPKSYGNRWSTDEIKKLRELAEKGYSDAEIGKKLGRTKDAIRNRRDMLGIKKSDNPGKYAKGKAWTDEEIKVLREMAKEGYQDKEIGEKIGRSAVAVCQKRKKLKINKSIEYRGSSKKWTDEELKTLERMTNEGYRDAEISQKLGRTPAAIQCMRQKIKVNLRSNRGNIHREFTNTTDMLIVMLTNEEDASPAYIGWLLHRSKKDVEKRIAELRISGQFDKIHNMLMSDRYNSIYAIKMRRKLKKQKMGRSS